MKLIKTAKIAKPVAKGLRTVAKGVSKNSNWLLAALGMVGLAGTTWQMVDATIKAVKICEEKQLKDGKEILKTVWKLYIPGVGFILLTTLSIAGHTHLNRILSKQLLAATSIYAASQADMKAFKDKAVEMLGDKKVKKIQDEADEEYVKTWAIPDERDIAKTGHGNQLFRLSLNGGYFRANPDWIELQMQELNKDLNGDTWNEVYVYRALELFHQPEADIGNLTWNQAEMLERGYTELTADISETYWIEHHGTREIVSVVRIKPWPTGL